jgi:hypothetical protein
VKACSHPFSCSGLLAQLPLCLIAVYCRGSSPSGCCRFTYTTLIHVDACAPALPVWLLPLLVGRTLLNRILVGVGSVVAFWLVYVANMPVVCSTPTRLLPVPYLPPLVVFPYGQTRYLCHTPCCTCTHLPHYPTLPACCAARGPSWPFPFVDLWTALGSL